MSKDTESAAALGLLSKVVKFVSNPTKDWKELDELDSSADEDPTAQQVRERIERKRRNDFIRKTEFDQLRKIIYSRRKQRQPQLPANAARTPSASTTDLAGAARAQIRTGTLKKIDAIEKQMSSQWWQGERDGEETDLPSGVRVPERTQTHSMGGTQGAAVPEESDSGFFLTGSSLFFADEVKQQFREVREQLLESDLQKTDNPIVARWMRIQQAAACFGLEEEFVHESDLEEAAILFASNRVQDAEKVLVDVIRRKADSQDPRAQIPVWLALFDLYRATGQQEHFDIVAIDFARLYGRTSPIWISIPELLGEDQAAAENKRSFSWMSSPELTVQSVATVSALKSRSAAPYQLNWAKLANIQVDALVPLTEFITSLVEQPDQVIFAGARHLLDKVQAHTEAGNAQGLREWWLLRLALLRLMGRQEEFELVALDFTVTYEESPPAWVEPRASYQDDTGGAEAAATAQSAADHADSRPLTLHEATLSGRIENDATDRLDQTVAELDEDAPIAIDCARLISIDFPAAGSVLNWAALQQSKGRLVAFTNLHRLVAVFFNIIGINEHARIVPRKD